MTGPTKALLILASASPRRKELLKEAGYKFKVSPADIDETSYSTGGIKPSSYAEKLALAKAKNAAWEYPEAVVIGADTLVDLDGQIIGKPKDSKDAERILRKLSGKPHKVITGLAIVRLNDGIEIVRSRTTKIYPKAMTDEQIAKFIEEGRWRDKSGACAIEDIGDELVGRIEGSISNVSGLPMELLSKFLEELGLHSPVTRAGNSGNGCRTGR